MSEKLNLAKKFVSYDPKTGVFVWLKRDLRVYDRVQSGVRFNNKCAGKRADRICSRTGYRLIAVRINGEEHYIRAHRLAWFLVYGEEPNLIDHLNGDRSDNRIDNLRSVDQVENARNIGLSKRNTSGVLGVSYCNTRKKWCAKGLVGKTRKHLGYFDTKEAATDARKKFETGMGYHPNNGGRFGWVRTNDKR